MPKMGRPKREYPPLKYSRVFQMKLSEEQMAFLEQMAEEREDNSMAAYIRDLIDADREKRVQQ